MKSDPLPIPSRDDNCYVVDDLLDLLVAGEDRSICDVDGADGGGRGLHRVVQWWYNFAGSQDGLLGWGHAERSADRDRRGAVSSSLVIGVTLLALNSAGVHYTNQNLPTVALVVPEGAPREQPGKPHTEDKNVYRVVHVRARSEGQTDIMPGRYLVDDQGIAKYRTDLPINRKATIMDDGKEAPKAFEAPQPQLFSSIIEGILGGQLEWGLVIVGGLIAVSLELARISALPFAVGMYLPLGATSPIFIGGCLRWLVDRWQGISESDADQETSPGILLSSGYIAGGTLCGLMMAFFAFLPSSFTEALQIGRFFRAGVSRPRITGSQNRLRLHVHFVGDCARRSRHGLSKGATAEEVMKNVNRSSSCGHMTCRCIYYALAFCVSFRVGFDLHYLIRWIILYTAMLAIPANGLVYSVRECELVSLLVLELTWGLIAWSVCSAGLRFWWIWGMTAVAIGAFTMTEPSSWTSTAMFSPMSALFCWLLAGSLRLRVDRLKRYSSA